MTGNTSHVWLVSVCPEKHAVNGSIYVSVESWMAYVGSVREMERKNTV